MGAKLEGAQTRYLEAAERRMTTDSGQSRCIWWHVKSRCSRPRRTRKTWLDERGQRILASMMMVMLRGFGNSVEPKAMAACTLVEKLSQSAQLIAPALLAPTRMSNAQRRWHQNSCDHVTSPSHNEARSTTQIPTPEIHLFYGIARTPARPTRQFRIPHNRHNGEAHQEYASPHPPLDIPQLGSNC